MKTSLLAALVLAGAAVPALAQDAPKAAAPQPPVVAIRSQIDDLALLKALIPLKLTVAQIDVLLPPLRAASKAAAALKKTDDAAVQTLGPDVGEAYKAALKNEPIPEALEKKIVAENKAATDRLTAARKKATGEILEAAKETLTVEQKTEIERQCVAFYGGKRVPKAFADKPDKAPREVVLDLAVQGFIEQVLLFDRALTLLEKIKEALK